MRNRPVPDQYWHQLPLLGLENYAKWAFKMSLMFKFNSLWDVQRLCPHKTDIAHHAMFTNVSDSQMDILMDSIGADASWLTLKETHCGSSVPARILAMKSVAAFCFGTDIEADFALFKTLARRLQSAFGGSDATISISDLLGYLMLSVLPAEFDGIRAVIAFSLDTKESLSIMNIEQCVLLAKTTHELSTDRSETSAYRNGSQCQHRRIAKTCWSCHSNLRPECIACKGCKLRFYHAQNSKFC